MHDRIGKYSVTIQGKSQLLDSYVSSFCLSRIVIIGSITQFTLSFLDWRGTDSPLRVVLVNDRDCCPGITGSGHVALYTKIALHVIRFTTGAIRHKETEKE